MRKLLLVITSICIVTMLQAQVSKTVNVVTAGTLSSLLTASDYYTINKLTVTGSINNFDFVTMNQISYLHVLDLSGSNCAYIPANAFQNCIGLTDINIPSSVMSIDNHAFAGCIGLKTLNIPSWVQFIGDYAFYECDGLTTIDFAASAMLNSIGNYAFYGDNSLTTINIPASVVSIGNYAFSGCSGLTAINIPPTSTSLTSIGDYAFSDLKGLTTINIPASVVSIGNYAFSGCSGLSAINIPSTSTSLSSIGNNAFNGCSSLISTNIPASVFGIGKNVFNGCSSLISIYSYVYDPIFLIKSDSVFEKVDTNTCVLFIPSGAIAAYKAAAIWKSFRHIVVIGTNCIATVDTINITACGSYVLNDSTYTKSGTYIQTLTTSMGCDSIIILQLTVTNLPLIKVTAIPDTIAIGKSSVLLASGGNSYRWSNSLTTVSQTISPTITSTFLVTGID